MLQGKRVVDEMMQWEQHLQEEEQEAAEALLGDRGK